MHKLIAILLALLVLISAAAAAEQSKYWEAEYAPVVCEDNNSGCLVLQMVMMGSFAEFDPNDNLNIRVLSAALPLLCDVTEDDFAHFCKEFGEDSENVKTLYYEALSNCLWADILLNPADGAEESARTVLLLFLNPDGTVNSDEQIAFIREALDDDTIAMIADVSGLPEDFVRHLLLDDTELQETEDTSLTE